MISFGEIENIINSLDNDEIPQSLLSESVHRVRTRKTLWDIVMGSTEKVLARIKLIIFPFDSLSRVGINSCFCDKINVTSLKLNSLGQLINERLMRLKKL